MPCRAKSAIGCLQTALSWILIRRIYSGHVRSTASRHWPAGARVCRLIPILSRRWTMFVCSTWSSRQTSASINVFPAFVQHVSYWLRQLRRVRRSLDDESTKTLVPARVDYCNMVLAGAPRSVTDRLQRVLNAVACHVSGTRQYDRGLSQLLHTDLYWLDRCGKSSLVQGRHHSPPVSAQHSAKVPDRLLCRWSSETAFSRPSSAGCTALSTNNTRVLCRWINRLEFASRRAKRRVWEHCSAVTENTAQTLLARSAH